MNTYKGNLRDTEFILFEYQKMGDIYGKKPFEHLDVNDARMMLREALKFAGEVMGEVNAEGDRCGCIYDEGRVITPPVFKDAYQKYIDAGWQQLFVDREDGGAELNLSLGLAINEFFLSANFSLNTLVQGSGTGVVIKTVGTKEQAKRFCPELFKGRWGGAMALSEDDVGSDVGAIKTKARKIDGNVYAIEGSKRFITHGDFDLVDNVITLLLARVEGAQPGTKGLSMFIIPKIWVNEDGSLGDYNDVVCTGIEHKMGINGSPTCQMRYGENDHCRGILVGDVEGVGMKQMFVLMNKARLLIGMQAMGQASSAYLNSLSYAKERLQGSDMKESQHINAPKVPILRHPDVRRMLMEQKSKLEGMRSLILKAAHLMDLVKISSPEEAVRIRGKIDLLTPIIKGYCSEEGFHCVTQAMQIFGGSGYCRDYPIEQYLRDAKVSTLYEGTTHIQALDIVRKLNREDGRHFINQMEEINSFIQDTQDRKDLAEELQLLREAVSSVRSQREILERYAREDIYLMALQANNFLFSLSEVVIASILLEMAMVAAGKLAGIGKDHLDYDFYRGKIESARFYCKNILPGVFGREKIMLNKDTSALDIPDGAF